MIRKAVAEATNVSWSGEHARAHGKRVVFGIAMLHVPGSATKKLP